MSKTVMIKNIGLITQLDLLTLIEAEKVIEIIDSIENAFNKIDLERFEE